MATKTRSMGSRAGGRGGSVSLADEDRRYLNESLNKARGRVGNADLDEGGVFEALERFGLSSDRVERLRTALADLDVRESIDKASEYLAEQIENARDYTKENPGKVIGGAAGVLVGASLLALAIRRAAGEEKKSRQRAAAGRKGGRATASASAKKAAAGRKGGLASSGSSKKSSSRKSGSSSKRSSGSSSSSRKSSGSKKASKRR